MGRCTRSSPNGVDSRRALRKERPFLYARSVPLRVGVLGAGFAGAMHAHSAMGLDDVQVVAVAALLILSRNALLYGWTQATLLGGVVTIPVGVFLYLFVLRRWSRRGY